MLTFMKAVGAQCTITHGNIFLYLKENMKLFNFEEISYQKDIQCLYTV